MNSVLYLMVPTSSQFIKLHLRINMMKLNDMEKKESNDKLSDRECGFRKQVWYD